MKKTRSIRTQLYTILALTTGLCILVVLLAGTSTHEAVQGVDMLITCNSSLSDFYVTVDKMDILAKEWIYDQSEEGYASYLEQVKIAREELSTIGLYTNEYVAWRFQRLEYMLDYYQEPLDDLLAGRISAYETYNLLYYRSNLIRNTAPAYYTHLAEYLQDNADTIMFRWTQRMTGQLVALVLLLFSGLTISGTYGKLILHPIQVLMKNAKRIQQGNFVLDPVGEACSELSVMANTFEEMAGYVERNMDVLKENAHLAQMLLKEERERLAMKNLVTQAELRSLQAQINPHFLFNTLSMISQSAYLSEDIVTSELIDRLSDFLRYALDKSNTTSTLKEEVHSIDNYMFIQKKRFGDRLDFILDIPDYIPDLSMPAIVLQPLVENAVKHGIATLTEDAVISLKIRLRENRVRIQIEDNGAGMPAEQLEKLLSTLSISSEGSEENQSSIGLMNVYRRMKLFFGTDFRFSIESEENCGTIVSISLPTEEL